MRTASPKCTPYSNLFLKRLQNGMVYVATFAKTESMFKNYCITAFRNLVRNKRFGLIG